MRNEKANTANKFTVRGVDLFLAGFAIACGGAYACAGPAPAVKTVEEGADAACQVFLLLDPNAPEIAKEGCLTVEQLDKMKLRTVKVPKASCPPASSR